MPELKITKTTTTTSELAVMVERHAHGPLPTFTAPDPDELPLIAEAALAAMPDEQREEVLIKYGRLAHVSTHTLDGLGKENARLRAEIARMRPVVEAAVRARDRRDLCLDNYARGGMSPDKVYHLGIGSYATQHDLNLWRTVDEYRSRK